MKEPYIKKEGTPMRRLQLGERSVVEESKKDSEVQEEVNPKIGFFRSKSIEILI